MKFDEWFPELREKTREYNELIEQQIKDKSKKLNDKIKPIERNLIRIHKEILDELPEFQMKVKSNIDDLKRNKMMREL
jgi:hypothetical protein